MCENSLYPARRQPSPNYEGKIRTDALKDAFLVVNVLLGAVNPHGLFPELLDLVN